MKKFTPLLLIAAFIFCKSAIAQSTDTLIATGSVWKYFDNGTDPGVSWKDSTFNDNIWASGPSEFGYGDGGEATLVNACGVVAQSPACTNKYPVTYFRRRIFIPDAARYNYYRASVVRDDGAVVYVNGQEVWRNNMAAGAVTNSTFANVTADGANETALNNFNIINPALFVNGWNTIAVSIHQVNGTSSDISFNMRLIGDTSVLPPVVLNAPNGGELYYANTTANITWLNNTLTGTVTLEYSTDGKATWVLITNSALASAQTFAWTVPNIITSNAWVRISSTADATKFDTSNSRFDILPLPVAFNPCVQPDHIGCFTSVQPMAQTLNLRIPAGTHTFQRIARAGDPLTLGGVMGNSNDFTNYIPTSGSSKLGTLAINQETSPTGVTIFYVRYNDTSKLWVKDSSGRVNFNTPGLVNTGNNCSGGLTPWNTTVTAEETTGGGDANLDGYNDLGWLVEIDPVTRQVRDYNNDGLQDKLWAMGRMSHENVVFKNDSLTAYFGEDGGTSCVYKFIANQKMRFDAGTLYVLQRATATSSRGVWIQVPNTTQVQRNTVSATAATLGGTNFNGVEDVEINPLNGMIYFTSKNNSFIYRFVDNGSTVSYFENYVGNSTVTYPINYGTATANEAWGSGIDNLAFDNLGNLWANQDGSRGHFWVIRPDHTPASPKVELFATTPVGSESTGLTFTPDFKYGFVSFQHPLSSNTAKQADAAGDSITFNTHTSIVFANRNHLGNAPLPVQFLDFNVTKAEKNAADVRWSTATETNSNHFTVERSLNGADFTTVKVVKGAGNSSRVKQYSFRDANLPYAVIYYRIKQTDLDGKTAHTSIKSVNLTGQAQSFSIREAFPNPFTNDVFLNIVSEQDALLNLTITDLSGKPVYTTKAGVKKGNNQLLLKLEQLAKGTYILNAADGSSTQNFKLLKN